MSSRGVNKVILVGYCAAPEIRATSSGDRVANLSLATTERWKDKQTGEQKEHTEWHRLVAFKRLAEIIEQYVSKGALLYVDGRLQTRKWQDQNGQDRYTTEVKISEMQMLGGRPDGSNASQPAQSAPAAQSQGGPDIDFGDVPF